MIASPPKSFTVRQFERYPIRANVSFEILDKKSAGGGLLRNISLAGGFVESPRSIPLHSWMKLNISAPKCPDVQTMGQVLRRDGDGFALHFNWFGREPLRKFLEILKTCVPADARPVASCVGDPPGSSPSLPDVRLDPGNPSALDLLYRKSWASFVENASPRHLEMMTKWSREIFLSESAEEDAAGTFDDSVFVGKSQAIQDVMKKIRAFAPTALPVLLIGETGSGKEVFSRYIHQNSPFREGPFVPVNCGAIPDHLAESLLFGHEKGSFSGAHQTQKGYMEAANGGTLLLDEIGELPLMLQVKLLRVLQERTFSRVGSHKEIPLQCRIVSATNKNLKEEVRKGTFREDLYYRLEGVMIAIPPLRDHKEDLPQMADFLVRKLSDKMGFVSKPLSAEARRKILESPWTGNVRELYNSISRAIITSEHSEILPKDLGLSAEETKPSPRTLRELREAFEKNLFWDCLRRNKGNISRVSEELGISRPSVYSMLKKFRFDPSLF